MIPKSELFEVSSTYWLTVLTLGLCVAAGYVWRITVSKSESDSPWQRIVAYAAAVVLCLIAVDGLHFTFRDLSEQFQITGVVGVIAATVSLTWLHLSHRKTPNHLFRRRLSGWLVLFSSVAVIGWSYHRFQQRLDPHSDKPRPIARTPGAKRVIREFVALTDRNHPIPVYRLDEDVLTPMNESEGAIVGTVDSVIQRSPPNASANCHGWVFLDSRFLIPGEAVQQILDDNGYEMVLEPRAGDVIIYRDANRNIMHSGVVRGVLDDETVIVESKWGTEGTFLHDPIGTPYGPLFEFLRSPRHSNRVQIVPIDVPPADAQAETSGTESTPAEMLHPRAESRIDG